MVGLEQLVAELLKGSEGSGAGIDLRAVFLRKLNLLVALFLNGMEYNAGLAQHCWLADWPCGRLAFEDQLLQLGVSQKQNVER